MTAMPYFVADSASVTVLRSLASTAFGKYNLTLPDGVDLEDVYEVAAPGNELAYVASLGARRRVGGMFRRFVRADVNVTAQGEDMVPASDVERVLNDAEKRVSGDFFLESDITKAGLGPWVPFVDFNVGDIVNVEIWGRVVPLAVTRIEPKRTEHSDNDWSVHVGGQLLSDAEARLAENADIYNAVVSDRRDLAGLDGKIRAETNNRKAAVSAEREARTAGDEALSKRIDALPSSESLNAEITGLNERIRALGGESAAARDALMERLRGELAEASESAASAREGLQRELEGKITALGGAQDEARRRDMEALNGRISGLNSDLTLLKQTEINALQQKWNAQQGEINKQNEQYRKLQSEWNRQQGEINDQNAKYQQLDAEWKKQQQEINRQGSEFRELQTVINDKQTGINALNFKFQTEQDKTNKLNEDFRAEQGRINKLQGELSKANKAASDANAEALHAQDLVVRGMPRMLHVDDGKPSIWDSSEGSVNNASAFGELFFSRKIDGGRANFRASGGWTGVVWLMGVTVNGSTDIKVETITSSNRFLQLIPNGLGNRYKASTAWIFPDVTV